MQALWHRLVFFAMLALAALTNSPWVHAQEATSLRIGQATTSVSFLAIWAARALDTFKPQEIDLKWAAIPGGDPTVLAALDAGDIDLAAVGTDTPLAAVAKGQDFVLVYALMSQMSLELVVSNAFLARKGISPSDPLQKQIESLKGATIGVSAVRGAQDRVARWLVAQAGLDPQATSRWRSSARLRQSMRRSTMSRSTASSSLRPKAISPRKRAPAKFSSASARNCPA